jgi:hypothetical protein
MEGERTVCSNKSGITYFLRFNCDFEQLIILFKKMFWLKFTIQWSLAYKIVPDLFERLLRLVYFCYKTDKIFIFIKLDKECDP